MTGKIRRYLLLLALAFSFGGFTFYAGAVIPIATDVVGKTTQGFVTRRVTNVLNLATVVTVVLLFVEAIAARRERTRTANAAFIALTTAVGLCCVALILLHPQLEAFMTAVGQPVTDRPHFYRAHQFYLSISALQWLFTLPLLWILVSDRSGNNGRADEQH
jgi:hypothetical protein